MTARTITKTITVYKFSELSESAKQHVKDRHSELFGYSWSDEALDSLKSLAEFFGGRLKDYGIDWFACTHSYASFEMPELSRKEIADRLKQLGTYNRRTLKGHGDCKLTGFCMDEAAIDGFRIAFKREQIADLRELMDRAFDSWLKECQSDCEWQYSDEAFGETCDANDWEFDVSGEIVRE